MSNIIYYLIWTSIVTLFYIFYTYVSFRSNQNPNSNWFWAVLLTGAFPGWAIVSLYSKNLLFDGLLYDVIMFLTYAIAIGYFTDQFMKFATSQWIGFIMIIVGFLLVRWKF